MVPETNTTAGLKERDDTMTTHTTEPYQMTVRDGVFGYLTDSGFLPAVMGGSPEGDDGGDPGEDGGGTAVTDPPAGGTAGSEDGDDDDDDDAGTGDDDDDSDLDTVKVPKSLVDEHHRLQREAAKAQAAAKKADRARKLEEGRHTELAASRCSL